MATWTTPKTNWNSTDSFSASDWIRIVGNLEYITDDLGIAYTPYDAVSDGDVITSADRNVVLDMIETIYVELHASWNRDIVALRKDYGSTWSSRELNIIESTIEDFKKQIDGTLSGDVKKYCGEFVCGDKFTIGLL